MTEAMPLTDEELATIQRRHNEAREFGVGKTSLEASRLWAQNIGIDAHRDRRVLLATIADQSRIIAQAKLVAQQQAALIRELRNMKDTESLAKNARPLGAGEGAIDYFFLRYVVGGRHARSILNNLITAAEARGREMERERCMAYVRAWSYPITSDRSEQRVGEALAKALALGIAMPPPPRQGE